MSSSVLLFAPPKAKGSYVSGRLDLRWKIPMEWVVWIVYAVLILLYTSGHHLT
ncbi:hypothetical protein GCM10010981_32660 [Dyella nitratireducens]|uniref:Uncharacterized protein n=1 Tax=Dyella nitratireducens TaxID=1849580 RepID=A0ABQ1GC99_9GAMM|nr:hypothetical protein GCM10010981_32660 [Dyella nitratireducens]GLQ40624.1 hypothetical protein GCM10007902_04730 [Dyella nitratireducens]